MSEHKFIIPGRVRIKKNGKRVFRVGRAVRVLSSILFSNWEAIAVRRLRNDWNGQRPITGKIEGTFVFYFKNRQAEPDTSNCIEGPQDALQLAGIINNDKQIVKLHAEKIIDASQEERTEILIREI